MPPPRRPLTASPRTAGSGRSSGRSSPFLSDSEPTDSPATMFYSTSSRYPRAEAENGHPGTRAFSPSFSYPAQDPRDNFGPTNPPLSPAGKPVDAQTAMLQVIDEDQNFSPQLNYYMKHVWGLTDHGFDYNLVAVFGSQSTGKSTLLNRLFGTDFAVMDERARRQTTKGIWMSQSRDLGVLIMDVEGTDGRERGEDQEFERKSALFSMATAEVLLVNMWENMVGLYNGANMGLLKTVFEVNLQLFHDRNSRHGRTLLLFVIRDHVSKTTLDNLAATVKQDLDRLWSELSKPEGLEDSRIEDFFDFSFVSLPHKLLQPDHFNRQVDQLRLRFTRPSDPHYVFKPQYHKMIPADGFPKYAETIWEKIVSNRDLDLPTQQELLAQYRCDEIAAAVFDAFLEAVRPLRPVLEGGRLIDNLGEQMGDHRRTALAHFDKNASRYHHEVYNRKRREHLAKLNSELHLLFLAQIKNAGQRVLQEFRSTLKRQLGAQGGNGSDYDFGAVVRTATRAALERFEGEARALVLDDTDWSYAQEAEQLRGELDVVTDQLRGEELKKVQRRMEKTVRTRFADTVPAVLNDPKPDMWGEVLRGFFDTTDREERHLRATAAGLDLPASELDELTLQAHQLAWEALLARVHEETGDQMMLVRLRTCLEDRFRYDDQGIPRVWQPSDDIDGQFGTAKESTSQLIPLFSRIDTSGFEGELESYFAPDFVVSETLELLPATRQRDLAKRFQREADALYLEAKRSVVATTAQTPYWIIVLLFVLGWNEFVTVVTSPVYLILLVTFGTAGYVIHVLNLTGPVQQAARIVAASASRHVHTLLLEALNRTGGAEANAVAEQPTGRRRTATTTTMGTGNSGDVDNAFELGELRRKPSQRSISSGSSSSSRTSPRPAEPRAQRNTASPAAALRGGGIPRASSGYAGHVDQPGSESDAP
ncbi:Dynamin-like GTPase that mediates homotypic ER fusion [Tieghemiomyces parasiticus]|uniref:Dynamin-like GTPase that mediates homotypic ER fusion n=1 Tax=Tieghemiomyces parasiticus TaxID=78921 RepID=A0A9W8A510_9FUNG|nr:Dynamin-like GTPase that mediates homotypic ER fusion [Tieghemiomyces parasiticus]